MDTYMLLEFLKRNGLRGNNRDLIHEFKHYMRNQPLRMRGSRRHRDYDYMDYDYDSYNNMRYNRHDWMPDNDERRYMYNNLGNHFDMSEAKEIVSEMYHNDNGSKQHGEHFSMNKAEEVYNKYKHQFVTDYSVEDVYVALNATYHDLCSLYKSWFGSNVDERIILTAITFWFKDEDYQGNKIYEYFE